MTLKGDGLATARRLTEALGSTASFVPLDPRRGTGRVVVGKGEICTLDISSFKGGTIESDLVARDFTINSMAVSLKDLLGSGLTRILDPAGGTADLRERRVRVCSERAFEEDPLRILRAFRFQAQLGFRLSPETLRMIPAQTARLSAVAWERIRDEFMTILSTDRAFPALQEMDRCSVLEPLFPELITMKGVEQNSYHHLDVWDHTLESIHQLELLQEQLVSLFGESAPSVAEYLKEEPVPGRSRVALLKLALLFHDAGKPHTRTRDPDGRIRFFGHEKVSGELFEKAGSRLKLASRETQAVEALIRGHMSAMIFARGTPSRRAVFRLQRRFGRDAIGLLLIFLADIRATRGPDRSPDVELQAIKEVRSALESFLRAEESPPAPLLNGRDLMRDFGLDPGPFLGKILQRLVELQAVGEITSREEALAAVEELLAEHGREIA